MTDSLTLSKYWGKKSQLNEETFNEFSSIWGKLKLQGSDGKMYPTDPRERYETKLNEKVVTSKNFLNLNVENKAAELPEARTQSSEDLKSSKD